MEFKDYYQTLGVARDATVDDLKKAFRKLARKYHPDISKEKDAELRMKEINEAYAVLSDPEKRAAYDQVGSGYQPGQDFRPPPDWDAGFEFSGHGFSPHEAAGFSDFFSELFGRIGGAPKGARQINLRVPQMDAQGRVQLATRTLNVKIPAGVRPGQIIRLAGQGAPGMGGAAAGDLLLEVQFKPHPRYRVEGRDLHQRLPLAPWEAALGSIIEVDLPHGSVKVRIPEGAQSGRSLRVHGKGLPGNPPGDLLLDLHVVLPPADTQKARQLYESMAHDLAFDPRRSVKA